MIGLQTWYQTINLCLYLLRRLVHSLHEFARKQNSSALVTVWRVVIEKVDRSFPRKRPIVGLPAHFYISTNLSGTRMKKMADMQQQQPQNWRSAEFRQRVVVQMWVLIYRQTLFFSFYVELFVKRNNEKSVNHGRCFAASYSPRPSDGR